MVCGTYWFLICLAIVGEQIKSYCQISLGPTGIMIGGNIKPPAHTYDIQWQLCAWMDFDVMNIHDLRSIIFV